LGFEAVEEKGETPETGRKAEGGQPPGRTTDGDGLGRGDERRQNKTR
jgi:hypothetical protein